jgi:putative ubiquitin-RnfH superfamily antitoxin RatB of RatAB toxin-antitoxin module
LNTESDLFAVEVAYATPDKQLIIALSVPAGTTASQAIELSNIREPFAQIEALPVVGIFSEKVDLDYLMCAGDRLEIYRPLIADPKEVRRQKAEAERAKLKKRA